MATTWNTATGMANSGISNVGNIALWIGFAVTVTASVAFMVLSYIRNVKPEARLIYYLTTLINAITALAYLTMALGGTEYFPTYVNSTTVWGRGFMWIRYAAWALVAPLSLIILGLLSGAHWVDLVWVCFAAIVGVAGGFAAAISQGFNATWPLFTFAVMAGVPVAIALLFTFRRAAYKVHTEIGKLYDVVGLGSLVMYIGYVIVWGVSEGGKNTTSDIEVIVYTALDIMTKAVFGFVLIWSREAIARYGTWLGHLNTGVEFDFPIARATYTSSGSAYATEPSPAVVFGEHRDLAFAQLHAATNTHATVKSA